MLMRKTIFVWLGILVLSGMFLMGQESWYPCVDEDLDGYGSPASAECTFALADCDDTNPDANPGMAEICDNGFDDDCDGDIDGADSDCAACSIPADCDDDNLCTDDDCVAGTCENTNNIADCNDGNACTMNDGCSEGSCSGVPLDGDSDGYISDMCPTGNDCNDGDDTINPGIAENCTNGIDDDCDGQVDSLDVDCYDCTSDAECDDSNPCTINTCSAGSCQSADATGDCDDGDVCTMNDTCLAGLCSGPPLDADGDGHVANTCPSGTDCDDDNENVNPDAAEICDNFIDDDCDGTADLMDVECQDCTSAVDCDDDNVCTTDACVDYACQNTNNTLPCNDGNVCTMNDSCSAGICSGAPLDADGDTYIAEMCPSGSDCNDGNENINPGVTENCSNSIDDNCNDLIDGADPACVDYCYDAGDCDDDNVCTTDSCVDGDCFNENNTADCDDGDPCTMNDICSAGICSGPPLDADGDGHVVDTCTGGTDCNDGNENINPDVSENCSNSIDDNCNDLTDGADPACVDYCYDAGDCDDDDVCTTDSCSEGVCYNIDNTADCDDGIVCTMNDTCSAGICSGVPLDGDGDGYIADTCPSGDDCDDDDPDINPGAIDIPDNSIDEDCDGSDATTSDPVELIPASLLNVTSGTCVTYIGEHPVEPEQGFIQTYEFCGDGTVTKWWNPSPVDSPGTPGDIVCEGTWSYAGNVLTIHTASGNLVTIEIYDIAFTYDDGARLDLFSSAQDDPGDGSTVIGEYSFHTEVYVNMGWLLDMDTISDSITTVTDGDPAVWETTLTAVTNCAGFGCLGDPGGTVITSTDGTIVMPGSLYELGSTYILQTNDTFVLERQP